MSPLFATFTAISAFVVHRAYTNYSHTVTIATGFISRMLYCLIHSFLFALIVSQKEHSINVRNIMHYTKRVTICFWRMLMIITQTRNRCNLSLCTVYVLLDTSDG